MFDPENMKVSRRRFISGTAALTGAIVGGCTSAPKERASEIMTVRGPIAPEELGATLPHEHLFLDFIGADKVSRDRYDPEEVFRAVLPHLQLLKDCGGHSLVECTPAYIGRDVALLKRLAEAADVHVLTNTGYYGAAKNKFLPQHAHSETEGQLAARWIAEWRDGIDGTGICPGFIKIGVDSGVLSDVHRKLVRAAAQAHLTTGLTIAAHTGNGEAALDELLTLKNEGVSPQAFIWVHAQSEANEGLHLEAARQGAWVEFDHVSSKSLPRHVALVQAMRRAGVLQRVLVSHDAGWYEAGKPNGGTFRPFDPLFKEFIPALKEAGFTADEESEGADRSSSKSSESAWAANAKSRIPSAIRDSVKSRPVVTAPGDASACLTASEFAGLWSHPRPSGIVLPRPRQRADCTFVLLDRGAARGLRRW
jgi:predicted metal-dependent phosphotriesterase family hydrolase